MHQWKVFPLTVLFALASISGASAADGPPAKAATCTACHGADGNSINPIWPNLAGQGAPYIVAQLQAFKANERVNASMNGMAAPLSEDDMHEIAAYYAGQAPRVGALGDADVGGAEVLYRGGDAGRGIPACMACHGPSGAGNQPAGYPALRGQHAEYTALQLKAYRDGSRPGGPQNMMGTIAAKLSDADIEVLSRYLSALH